MKLYRVKTKKFSAYALSDSMDEAYLMVKKWLDERDYGFWFQRELESVELIATSEFNVIPDSAEKTDVIFLGEPSKRD